MLRRYLGCVLSGGQEMPARALGDFLFLPFSSTARQHAIPLQHLVSQHRASVNMQPGSPIAVQAVSGPYYTPLDVPPAALLTYHRYQGPTALNSLFVRPPDE